MTIHKIKADYISYNPEGHYFDRLTLKFFGQTLRDFSVKNAGENCYIINARIWHRGRVMGNSKAVYSFNEHKFVKEGE